MKLHRLVLTNYRGVQHRELEFPDHGVVVVSGVNEIGKTSMIQALDLLLKFKDRSGHRDVKAAKPTHADVGSEVTAEISTGPYRFVYHKRFHKCPETTLTLSAPQRQQLTGDEAHDRVCAILAETVDTALWQAQRVLQAASTDAVNLTHCDALARALDIAAGDAATLTGAESSLIESIDDEYARYFTPTGRPTGALAAANAALAEAETEADRCARLVADVNDRVRLHDELTEQLAVSTEQQQAADHRHTAAQLAADRAAELKNMLREAELNAAAAALDRTASDAAQSERERLRTDRDSRAETVSTLEAEVRQAAAAELEARADTEAAHAAVDEAAHALADADRRLRTARRTVDQLVNRAEADRLAARLSSIESTRCDHERVCDELSGITLTEAALRRIEDAASAVDRSQAALAAISAAVEFTAIAGVELLADSERVSLAAGQSWSTAADSAVRVEVPGVLAVQVRPGESALRAQAEFACAQRELTAALTAARVADVAAARQTGRRRRELEGQRDQLSATLAVLCADDPVDELSVRLEQLRGDSAGQPPEGADLDTARADLATADAECARAATEHQNRRDAAVRAAQHLAEQTTRSTGLRERLETLRAEWTLAAERLAAERSTKSDTDLANAADAARQAADAAAGRVAELSQQLAAAGPAAVTAELASASADAEALRTERDRVAHALRDLSVELDVIGTEGRQSRLDVAEADRDHAAAEHARVDRRARAVDLLRSVMIRHRDDTRRRYVEPFRAELQRLGRPVFGSDFEVDVDTDLSICSRTLHGRTVPYESLSGGAKEQLGILARLAGATLVAKEDTVPVLIDDALGFTDPDRLVKMGAVFDMVGAHGQLIVLTCTPGRYGGVKDAYRIDLSA